jgi:hypothetical protein
LSLVADADANDADGVFALTEGEDDYGSLPQLEDECA